MIKKTKNKKNKTKKTKQKKNQKNKQQQQKTIGQNNYRDINNRILYIFKTVS